MPTATPLLLTQDDPLSDPLEAFCAKDPSADECRVYEARYTLKSLSLSSQNSPLSVALPCLTLLPSSAQD